MKKVVIEIPWEFSLPPLPQKILVLLQVTSFRPLRAYVYREGLTRFASKPYSTDEEQGI